MVRAVDSDGQSDFASIFASVAQEQREKDEKHQTTLFMQVLDEMEATPAPHTASGAHRERQQGCAEEDPEDEFEAFKEFMAFRRRQARAPTRARAPHRKEYLRVDEEEDEDSRLWRQRQAKAKSERAEKVRKVHTLADLPRDDYDYFLGGPPLLDDTPALTIDEGRRLGDGEKVYTASIPGWFEHVELGVWVFRVEMLALLAVVVLLVGIYLGRRTMGVIRAHSISAPKPAAVAAPQQPQIIYAYPPPGMFQSRASPLPPPVSG
jgi:hypothetical protein